MRPTDLLDKPIAFHRCLAELGGSVNAGLMLSQALYWAKRTRNSDGWFWKTAEQWHEETYLTRTEQATARKQLKRLSCWQEELRGVPAKLFYRLDLEELDRLLTESKNPQIIETSLRESDNPVFRNPENKDRGILKTFLPTETTTKTTTETTTEREEPALDLAPVASSPDAVAILMDVFPQMPIYAQEVVDAADIRNLDLWRTICEDWRDNRYSTRNVTGMRDRYRQQLAKLEEQSNGQNQPHTSGPRISSNERAARQTLALILGQPLDGATSHTPQLGSADAPSQQLAIVRRR